MSGVSLTASNPGAEAFDFLLGKWDVQHRRLKRRLADADDWAEFSGTMEARPILAGLGNFDENVIHLPEGTYQACTLRRFSTDSKLWKIYWIDGRDPNLSPPMTGGFEAGLGIFHGNDTFEGRRIRVRFVWSKFPGGEPRWDQAFSEDGLSWETNWVMRFERG